MTSDGPTKIRAIARLIGGRLVGWDGAVLAFIDDVIGVLVSALQVGQQGSPPRLVEADA